ncbi:glutathione peroxidase [Cyclonatronum proteinivorum]|uniref:Glutathione peroxidase n=2 Tax=Cyclonatronum proteinivorum TaxID=1457365 RepID=A0A345UNH5_9BACT|nr:glutathione peroxidase [Cyclonatronum proteinivorum]
MLSGTVIPSAGSDQNPEKGIFDFTMTTLSGEEKDLSQFKGSVVLIVNTASKCGFTSQYRELQQLYETYADRDFTILGFPSADFGGQEFEADEDIAAFCERNFGVTFPMFSRISVRGAEQHPLFTLLTSSPNPDTEGDIRWNFEKFLLDQQGNLIRRFGSRTNPMHTDVTASIDALLE